MSGKPVVMVTGASRGLGAAVARRLAKAGAAVTLIARSEEELVADDQRIHRPALDKFGETF